MTERLLRKLYENGLIPTQKSLALAEGLSTSAFCRRRLAVMLVRLKYCEHLREATAFIEQGHLRVGPDTVRDPAYHVAWNNGSKIKRTIAKYSDKLDDADLLGV